MVRYKGIGNVFLGLVVWDTGAQKSVNYYCYSFWSISCLKIPQRNHNFYPTTSSELTCPQRQIKIFPCTVNNATAVFRWALCSTKEHHIKQTEEQSIPPSLFTMLFLFPLYQITPHAFSTFNHFPTVSTEHFCRVKRKTEGQSESQGMSLDVQTALLQGTDMLDGHFLNLWFSFAFSKSSASASDRTLCFSFDTVNSSLRTHVHFYFFFKATN